MKHIPKILLVIFLIIFILQMFILLILLIIPIATQAAKTHPMFDPGCWLKETCEELGNSFEESLDCGGDWGRCYPKTAPIPLQIKLQGQEKVTDIAEYIALLYKYTVGVSAVLAVAMIIWGGVVYLTAGGLPERITQAKEYISNAIIGLVLLYTSYLLLQTLNPDLVKLRMPRVYMLRPITLGTQFCQEIKVRGNEKFAEVTEDKPSDYVPQKDEYKISQENTMCNKVYMWPTGANQRCYGAKCEDSDKTCLPNEDTISKEKFECGDAIIAGEITYDDDAYADNDVDLHYVCNNGETHELAESDATEPAHGKQTFSIRKKPDPLITRAIINCGKAGLKGFYLMIEVNDEPGGFKGWLFRGTDDWFAVGKDNDKPISQGSITDPDDIDWKKVDKEDLIPLPENTTQPLDFYKRINITRDVFKDR